MWPTINTFAQTFNTVGYFTVLHGLRHQQQEEKNKSCLPLSAIRRSQRHCERVREGEIKKGLIWHFQGSGKSLLMLFAAQKLRKQQDLNNPTVMIVVDRVDLDTQITATFNTAEVPNMITTDSIKELHKLLEQDTRKIIITMVHKFKDAYPDMNNGKTLL
jgi:type I site-specific restriction-modification system R (restriction) subunit